MGKQVAHPTGRNRPLAGDNFNRFLDCARNDIFGGHGPPYGLEITIVTFEGTQQKAVAV
jgi:hypothetical protein